VCGWLLFATMVLYMDRLVLTQQEELIRKAFGIEKDVDYAFIDSAFNIAFAFGALLAGWTADRWSIWLLYPLVVILWSATGAVTGLISGYWALFTCRAFLGFFESAHWPCALKTSQRILAPSQRTLGNGILQSGAAIGSIVTPLALLLFAHLHFDWRPPFLFVGFLGLCWAVGWFFLVRREDVSLDPEPAATTANSSPLSINPPATSPRAGAARNSWLDVLSDRRFWILVIVVVCINSTWHYFRLWMPVILRKVHGFDKEDVQRFSIAYYVAADLGSLATGFGSVWLVSRGLSVHGSRLAVFGFCAALALFSLVAIILPGASLFLWVLPLVAFGSLGLFPPYYSFTQELTVRNQGKVTGTLGFICWMVMAGLRPIEGWVADMVGEAGGSEASRYAFGIVLAGIMPMVAVAVLFFFWPKETAPETVEKPAAVMLETETRV
jgi:ACS family hexuronate transporter-like MFS transporter